MIREVAGLKGERNMRSSSARIIQESFAGAIVALTTLAVAQDHAMPRSQWVYFNHSGKLVYRLTKAGTESSIFLMLDTWEAASRCLSRP